MLLINLKAVRSPVHSTAAINEAPSGASLLPGHEWFGKWQVRINTPWILDFALDGWRTVSLGTKRQMQKAYEETFRPVMVAVETRKGPQWKIDPMSGFILLGYGPVLEADEIEARARFKKSQRKGGWFEGELCRAATLRKALYAHEEYVAQGGLRCFDEWLAFDAPDHWFLKLRETLQ